MAFDNVGQRLTTTGTTSGILYTDRRDFFIKPATVAELYPTVAPFTTFAAKLKGIGKVPDPDYKLFDLV